MTPRMQELLLKVVKAFENGETPLSPEWNNENGLSPGEPWALMEMLAEILWGVVLAPDSALTALSLCSQAKDPEEAAMLVANFESVRALRHVVKSHIV